MSLYNAVNGTHYDDPEKLEIVTLENAIYMGMKNDLALSLIQTCFCMNISQHIIQICHYEIFFIYPANIRNLVDKKSLTLPYCRKYRHQSLLYFIMERKKKGQLGKPFVGSLSKISGDPKLELEVLTININEGHNRRTDGTMPDFKRICTICKMCRKYAEEYELNTAVKQAVDECIRNKISRNFFVQKNRR